MIIFFNKSNGHIYGVIQGRAHDDHVLNNVTIDPGDLSLEDQGKWVVPYKPIFKEVEEPIHEWRMVNEQTKQVVQVQTGTQKVNKPSGLYPDVSFADLIIAFEDGTKSLYDYKLILDKNGQVTDITLR